MSLVERVKGILLTPRTEWDVIAAEPTTPAALYTGYIMPLAAIGPVAQVLGMSVLGVRAPLGGAVYRAPIGSAIVSGLIGFVLSLLVVSIIALIIDGLAPTFGGTRSRIQALKTSAYASTASWLAGIFTLVPGLRVLAILGLYSIYLLYLGLPVTMKVPADRAGPYTGLVIVAAIVLFIIVAAIGSQFMMPAY